MKFQPPYCPNPQCPSRKQERYRSYYRRGFYRRACDGRRVQRFSCMRCERQFSTQTFRFHYRWQLPKLHLQLFPLFYSKVTHRQSARMLGVARGTVTRRLRDMAIHCREFHQRELRKRRISGTFLMDEMETFETDRRLMPVTIPVLIQSISYFVVHAESAPLAARGNLSDYHRRKKEELEQKYGKRRSGSRQAVKNTLQVLTDSTSLRDPIHLVTDKKHTYRTLFRKLAGNRHGSHRICSSKARRNYGNPLFPINHTLALMRDGVSRLVRRNWAHSKQRAWLDLHLWIWMAYRNYVRPVTIDAGKVTAAMVCGLRSRPVAPSELFSGPRSGLGFLPIG